LSAGSSRRGGLNALFTLPRWLFKHRGDGRWTNEHAISWLTVKVSFALNLAIVLASSVVQFNANPVSNGEVGGAEKADGGLSPIGQADDRTRGNLLSGHRECRDQ
jgi:hypothetical protein